MKIVVRHEKPIDEAVSERLPDVTVVGADTREDLFSELPDGDIFIVNPGDWDEAYLDRLQSGTWIQATSAGYGAFPLDEFEEKDIVFTNAAGNYGAPVADQAFALMLALGRALPVCFEQQQAHEWDRSVSDSLLDFEDRTLTVVGLGDIGEAIARRGRGFGMNVYGTKRDPAAYDGRLSAERVLAPDALADVLPETDVLMLAVPLTEETYHLIDEDALTALPNAALLVNVARGSVVDQDALVAALDDGELAGAGLDVFEEEPLLEDSPLWDQDDVVISPHLGGQSVDFLRRFMDLFLTNYDRRRDGEEYVNRIV